MTRFISEDIDTASLLVTGPPFTVTRYGSFGACVVAERDWLRKELDRYHQALVDIAGLSFSARKGPK